MSKPPALLRHSPFLASLVHVVLSYPWVAAIYVVLMVWVWYELRIIGAWVAGSVTQTLLCAIAVHVMMCIGDFDYYNSTMKPQYCESCNMWLRVEYLLIVAQTVILVASAPHWPLSIVMMLGLAYETYVCVQCPDRRTLDPLTMYKNKTPLAKMCAIKLGYHALLFVLFLAYIGPWIIFVQED